MTWRTRARSALTLALAVLAAAGCARKQPPTGGPPDLEPPRVIAVLPDSGATAVDRTTRITVEFSEAMDPRSASLAVDLAPKVEIRGRRWNGRRLSLILADSLAADRTYTLFVGSDARDQHGNTLRVGRTVPFTTAARFPAGIIEGVVEPVGFGAPGTYLWCYPEGQEPDSTAGDFEAVGLAGEGGIFRISGLEVPARYRLWAFADLNFNHSYEPEKDLLVPADTTIELSQGRAVATNLRLHVVNPRAPGRVKGAVLDSLQDERGVLRLIVHSQSDSTRRLTYELESRDTFDFKWDPGTYKVRAYRDLDRNKAWKPEEEPASDERLVTVPPGGEVDLGTFVLVRPAAAEAPK